MMVKDMQIIKIMDGTQEEVMDVVIVEYPFTIFINEKELITLLCSPSGLDYLAIGFLVSEGIIRSKEQIQNIRIDQEKGYAFVDIEDKSLLVDRLYGKRTITTGCGKGTVFYHVLDSLRAKPVHCKLQLETKDLFKLSTTFNQKSQLFKETGGVHSCALCSKDEILLFHEDVGRHNALDKVIGEAFLKNINVEDKILFTSGRISSEMIIKTSKRKIPIIVSRSAPTDLSANIARELGITLIGFVRGKRMNIYNGQERVFISS